MRRSLINRTFFIFESSALCFSIGFNGGLIDEHDGDIVFYRVDPVTFDTLQAFLIRCELDFSLALRTGKNVKNFCIYRHLSDPIENIIYYCDPLSQRWSPIDRYGPGVLFYPV